MTAAIKTRLLSAALFVLALLAHLSIFIPAGLLVLVLLGGLAK